MGRKKRTPAPNPDPPPLSPGATRRQPDAAAGDGDSAAVRAECEKALAYLQRGSHARARRLMKDAVARHGEGSPLLLRAHGTLHARTAAILDDPAARARHHRAALQAARRAVELAPDSVELAHFHAMLLYDAASDSRGYEEVVAECERGLSIEAPSDPAPHSLRLPAYDAEQVQSELHSLIQKAKLASISTWVKTLGGAAGDDKLRLIPVRRLAEDHMDLRLLPAAPAPCRPNENKKATKTPDERRKEIEVRVTVMKLLEQQQHNAAAVAASSPLQPLGDEAPSSSSQSSAARHRADRRKGGSRKAIISSASDRMDQVRAFWGTMPVDWKHVFLNTSISDLKSHYAAAMHKEKDAASAASDVLNEVLGFATRSGQWEFWACGQCGERFAGLELHLLHALREHVGVLSPRLQAMVPHEIDADWAAMLIGSSWRPVDATAALKVLEEEQADNIGPDRDKDSMSSDNWSSKDKSDTSKSSASPHNEVCDSFGVVMRKGDRKWPLSDDDERANILERIHSLFQILVKYKNLSVSHLNRVIHFALEELRGMPSGSLLINHLLDDSPLCICFLEASSLQKVLKFLQDLAQSCELNRSSEKDGELGDENSFQKNHNILEKVTLDSDSSTLILDGWAVVGKSDPENVDTDAFLSWLYAGSSIGEQLLDWNHMLDERSNQGMRILQMLKKEFSILQNWCEQKHEQLSNEEGVLAVDTLLFEEQRRRDHVGRYAFQGYEELLKKRQEELSERNAEELFNGCRSELDAISTILKEVHTSHFAYDEAFSGMTFDGAEEDDWRFHEFVHRNDSVVQTVVSKLKEQITMELSKIEARIMRSVAVMQQLELKLGPASVLDYRTILLPLLKSFLRSHLEELVDKDARERSDAASEAFLAELALDAKKNANKGGDTKQPHEKSKDKKKTKDSQRSKDLKDLSWSDQYLVHQDSADDMTSEQSQILVNCGDFDCKLSTSDDYLNEQEEELRHRVQLEAEERKLEETLEYQRRMEEEAKQKHLAEQCTPGAIHDDDDKASNRQYGTPAPQWSSSGKVADFTNHSYQDARQNELHVFSSDDPQNVHKARSAGVENSNDEKVDSGAVPSATACSKYDYEKMFHEDLLKAVHQSLVTANGKEVHGAGLKNAAGEYNCFLNVVIQSLWHLRRFQDEFLKTSSLHKHVEDPCAVCALYDIFIDLIKASKGQGEAIAPTSLRIALSKSYPNSKFFQEGQMNDASEVLGVIFECLHKSYTSHADCHAKSHESNSIGSWDRANNSCIAHRLFWNGCL